MEHKDRCIVRDAVAVSDALRGRSAESLDVDSVRHHGDLAARRPGLNHAVLVVLTHRNDLIDLLENPLLKALDVSHVMAKLGETIPFHVVLNNGRPCPAHEACSEPGCDTVAGELSLKNIDVLQLSDGNGPHPPGWVKHGPVEKVFLDRIAESTERALSPSTCTTHERPFLRCTRLRRKDNTARLSMLEAEIGVPIIRDHAAHPVDPRQGLGRPHNLDCSAVVGGEEIPASQNANSQAVTASSAA